MVASTKKKADKAKRGDPLVVNVARESDGYTFALDIRSAERVRELKQDEPLPDRSFVAFDLKRDFKQVIDPIIKHVLPLLTGLSPAELGELGGVSFYDPWHGRPLGKWRPGRA